MRNTRSGLMRIRGTPGVILMSKPAMTKKIGYDIFNLLLSMVSRVITNNIDNTSKRFLSIIQPKLLFDVNDVETLGTQAVKIITARENLLIPCKCSGDGCFVIFKNRYFITVKTC